MIRKVNINRNETRSKKMVRKKKKNEMKKRVFLKKAEWQQKKEKNVKKKNLKKTVFSHPPTQWQEVIFNIVCQYRYIWPKAKNCPVSMTTVMLVLVFSNHPSLVQWGTYCCRIGISRTRHPSKLFHELSKDSKTA